MKAILLDGSLENDLTGERVCAELTAQLQSQGWQVQHVLLRQQKIGNCAGDFFCWIRNPGMCNVDDDNRIIAEAVVNSDLMVYLTPVTFGGYSSALKQMVDHQIQNISPFFARLQGETHHAKRYTRYPNFLAVGWLDAPDPRAETIFRYLVQRNAINFYAQKSYCALVFAGLPDAELKAQTSVWLESLAHAAAPAVPGLLKVASLPAETLPAPRRVLLLVGSPRTHKSTSHALGSYLLDQMAARGVQTDIIHIYTVLKSPEKMRLLLEKLDAADLAVLAFPLYVDSLPAPVILLLERIAGASCAEPCRHALCCIGQLRLSRRGAQHHCTGNLLPVCPPKRLFLGG